ncbi:hypothetical protein [Rhodococcus koreensis]
MTTTTDPVDPDLIGIVHHALRRDLGRTLDALSLVAAALHVPLYEEARALRQRQQAHDLVRSLAPPLDAGGVPVLLVGGLLDTPWLLEPLADWFDLLHCRTAMAPVGFGVDCGERTTGRVLRALEELVLDTGRPALIGLCQVL